MKVKFKDVFEIIDGLIQRVAVFLPWTYQYKVRANLEKGSVLDIGCGKGWAWRYFLHDKSNITFSIGLDLWYEAINFCKNRHLYTDVVLADARFLPFKEKSFDNVLLLQLIEHLEKEESLKLLKQAERIARRKVIVGVPVGRFLEGGWHLSYWFPGELKKLGFKVRGYGLRFPFPKKAKNTRLFFLVMQFARFSCLFPLLTYFFPKGAYQMVAVKIISKSPSQSEDRKTESR